MARTIPAAVLEQWLSPEMGTAYLVLLEINEASLSDPIRLVHNPVSVVSNGDTYIPMYFAMELPEDAGENAGQFRIAIDNVDRQIVQAVRLAVGRPTVAVSIVASDDLDTIIVGPMNFVLDQAEYDVNRVVGMAIAAHGMWNEWPAKTRTPSTMPDVF